MLRSIVYLTVSFYRKIATSSIQLDIDVGRRLSRQDHVFYNFLQSVQYWFQEM